MIILTGFVRDAQNPDNVIATIAFDINGMEQDPLVVDAPMIVVEPLPLDDIKGWIRSKVAEERGNALWSSVAGKLDSIRNVDLEEVPEE